MRRIFVNYSKVEIFIANIVMNSNDNDVQNGKGGARGVPKGGDLGP